jgi:hypothetical protein
MIQLLLQLMERQPARVVEHLVVAFWVLLRSPHYQQMLRSEQPDEEQSDSQKVMLDGAHVIDVSPAPYPLPVLFVYPPRDRECVSAADTTSVTRRLAR